MTAMIKSCMSVAVVIAMMCVFSGTCSLAQEPDAAEAPEEGVARMRTLNRERKAHGLIDEFGETDLSAWPDAAEAFHQRGQAYVRLKDAEKAKQDLEKAVELSPGNGYFWHTLAGAYRQLLKDNGRALEAYNKAFELVDAAHGSKPFGWMPLGATIEAASILMQQAKYAEALETLKRYDDEDISRMGTYWGARMLRTRGQVYLATGREEEAMAKYKAALELENKKGE